jgi:signal transduction histidine kinase
MPPELAHRFEDSFVRVFESDEPLVVEYSLEVGDGMRDFEARIVRSDDDMIVSIVRNVTEQKTSERSLKGSEAVLRATQLENQTLCGRLIAAQEAVSQRIARDLHDDLGQKLALLNLEVQALAGYGADQLGLEARVRDVSSLVEQIAVDVHNVSRELHPYQLSLLGLVDAIDGIVRDTSRQYGIVVDFRHRDVPRDIDDDVALCLHRVVQEALHNVVKHSGAKAVTVELTGGRAALELSVADQGCGFATDAPNRVGLGLVSMTERVKFIGGEIMICSSPGAGTRLDVRVPS